MATNLPIPDFFAADAAQIESEIKSFYESLTGKTLNPADTETFLFKTMVFREVIYRNNNNSAALQNLAAFATFPVLDYLAQNVGIIGRNAAQKATTKIEFVLQTGHPNLVIQAGTRISHENGTPVFEVPEDVLVVSGVDTIEIECISVDSGVLANGFASGTIKVLLDTFTYFDSCENTTITSGGSEEETDEQLRERIYLAPAAFSSCGPIDAYKFFALSAHPDIIDVAVVGPETGQSYPPPGVVAIYVLTNTQPTPSSVIAAVEQICSPENKRPTTDVVEVAGATAVDYAIQVNVTLYKGADDQSIIQQMTDLLNIYKNEKKSKLGLDVVREQISALCVLDGVYKPNLVSPAADVAISKSEFANCTGITINIVGYSNG